MTGGLFMLKTVSNKLLWEYDGEKMQIEPWGENSLRVRVTRLKEFTGELGALLPSQEIAPDFSSLSPDGKFAVLSNGKINVMVNEFGKLIFKNSQEKALLEEYESGQRTALNIQSREMKCIGGSNFRISLKFESNPCEKLFGMGQYQNGIFNLKGSSLELAQRNSQASIPFLLSGEGYGFLWNNPAVSRATFATNMTEWTAECACEIDFWITAGDSPREIISNYENATGLPPMMPEYALGFWQSKLRYQTQDELMNVAREYHKRGIPLDVIVADFFHWTHEGTWAFDKEYWPDPEKMVKELEAMGTKLMVSVWPTVSVYAPDYQLMKENGYLVRSEKGVKINMLMFDPTSFLDVTKKEAREFFWSRLYENYYKYGIKDFWLDVAEPEYSSYDFDNYRYEQGSVLQVGNQYPVWYTKAVYDGLKEAGEKDIVSLVRCAWAGSQRYGALVWSGDIASTFSSFKKQIVCGMHMAVAGIPWWTTDIGGFEGGNIEDPEFRELVVRWFQYATYCPVMRLHGHRQPFKEPLSDKGGGRCGSGADNEIWSFGEEAYEIMKKYIDVRNEMRDYIRKAMVQASREGCPIIRPLFYEFPDDSQAWNISDEYMFGDDILVAPVTEYLKRSREVYLPEGCCWVEKETGAEYKGGQTVCADAPLDVIPVFIRKEGV